MLDLTKPIRIKSSKVLVEVRKRIEHSGSPYRLEADIPESALNEERVGYQIFTWDGCYWSDGSYDICDLENVPDDELPPPIPDEIAQADTDSIDVAALEEFYSKRGAAVSRFTLPVDSQARKEVQLVGGCLRYFPAALAGVARHSKAGNDKHNPGEPMHHARDKSGDHEECILRHLTDLQDIRAALERGGQGFTTTDLLIEANALCWRALALSQELHEQVAGAPLAPGAG